MGDTDMSVVLKNDWEAVGSSTSAKNMADWMNMVANQFNGASVPSGGTAQPTALGFQIEVDIDSFAVDEAMPPYHFEVEHVAPASVKVRGGWWSYYVGDARVQVDLADGLGLGGTITSFDDFTEDISALSTAGVVYLELDISSITPTLIAKFATDAAWAALVDAEDIMRKLIARKTVDAGVVTIGQDWRGGNILTDKADIEGLDFWKLGDDYLSCYGESIGAKSGIGAAVSVIDLINRDLEGGDWDVTATTLPSNGGGALQIAGGVYTGEGIFATGKGLTSTTYTPAGFFRAETSGSSNYEIEVGTLFEGLKAVQRIGGMTAILCSGRSDGGLNAPGYFSRDDTNPKTVTLCDFAYAVDAVGKINTSDRYYVDGVQVVGNRGATVADPAGGATIDAEARTAIDTIIDRLQAHGLIS